MEVSAALRGQGQLPTDWLVTKWGSRQTKAASRAVKLNCEIPLCAASRTRS